MSSAECVCACVREKEMHANGEGYAGFIWSVTVRATAADDDTDGCDLRV